MQRKRGISKQRWCWSLVFIRLNYNVVHPYVILLIVYTVDDIDVNTINNSSSNNNRSWEFLTICLEDRRMASTSNGKQREGERESEGGGGGWGRNTEWMILIAQQSIPIQLTEDCKPPWRLPPLNSSKQCKDLHAQVREVHQRLNTCDFSQRTDLQAGEFMSRPPSMHCKLAVIHELYSVSVSVLQVPDNWLVSLV